METYRFVRLLDSMQSAVDFVTKAYHLMMIDFPWGSQPLSGHPGKPLPN